MQLLRRASILTCVVLTMLLAAPQAFALRVSVGDINSDSDVRDLFDDVSDELDNELEDLQDDCERSASLDLDEEEDNLEEDIEDIYDEARDSASDSFDDDLNDDEDDLLDDLSYGVDDLRRIGCDNGSVGSTGNFGTGFNSFFPQTSGRYFTTITPILPSYSTGGCSPLSSLPGYFNFSGASCNFFSPATTNFNNFAGFGGYGSFNYNRPFSI